MVSKDKSFEFTTMLAFGELESSGEAADQKASPSAGKAAFEANAEE